MFFRRISVKTQSLQLSCFSCGDVKAQVLEPVRERVVGCRSQLQIRCLGYLNDLKFVIFCHSEYVCRSFFKTRNSRTSKFHVVFLFPREFSGVRFTFRIAKHVKFIHFNLPSTIISCARILSKKKIHLYVNEIDEVMYTI